MSYRFVICIDEEGESLSEAYGNMYNKLMSCEDIAWESTDEAYDEDEIDPNDLQAARMEFFSKEEKNEEETSSDIGELWDEFIQWRNQVDSDVVLDQYDLALGWFSGKGCTHDEAIGCAKRAMEEQSPEMILRLGS